MKKIKKDRCRINAKHRQRKNANLKFARIL